MYVLSVGRQAPQSSFTNNFYEKLTSIVQPIFAALGRLIDFLHSHFTYLLNKLSHITHSPSERPNRVRFRSKPLDKNTILDLLRTARACSAKVQIEPVIIIPYTYKTREVRMSQPAELISSRLSARSAPTSPRLSDGWSLHSGSTSPVSFQQKVTLASRTATEQMLQVERSAREALQAQVDRLAESNRVLIESNRALNESNRTLNESNRILTARNRDLEAQVEQLTERSTERSKALEGRVEQLLKQNEQLQQQIRGFISNQEENCIRSIWNAIIPFSFLKW